jgi:hypothetical protein
VRAASFDHYFRYLLQTHAEGSVVDNKLWNGIDALQASSFLEAAFSVLRDAPPCKGRAHPTFTTLVEAGMLSRLVYMLTACREGLSGEYLNNAHSTFM